MPSRASSPQPESLGPVVYQDHIGAPGRDERHLNRLLSQSTRTFTLSSHPWCRNIPQNLAKLTSAQVFLFYKTNWMMKA